MYNSFFGFSEKPFEITHDPKFLYLDQNTSEVLDSIILGIDERRGGIAIVGEVGTGKTTLTKALMYRLPEKIKATYIYNANLTFKQILIMALNNLELKRLPLNMTEAKVVQRLSDFAAKQFDDGGNVVIILDEAHNLDGRVFSKLDRIFNLKAKKRKLVQLILSGQPELDKKLGQPKLKQFTQSLGLRCRIAPLGEKDTCEYIEHRLNVSNNKIPSLFSPQALKLIWQITSGVPRKINLLCDNALLIGYGLGNKKIEEAEINKAAQEMSWSTFAPSHDTQTLSMAKAREAKIAVEDETTQEPVTSEFILDTEERKLNIAEEKAADPAAEAEEADQEPITAEFAMDAEDQEAAGTKQGAGDAEAEAEEAGQEAVTIEFAADDEEQELIIAEEEEADLAAEEADQEPITIEFAIDAEDQNVVASQEGEADLAAKAEEGIQGPATSEFISDTQKQEPIFAKAGEVNLETSLFSDRFVRAAGVVLFCFIFSVGFFIGNSKLSLHNAISFFVGLF